ncbi:MAG TPA: 50S ribosomal protein L39e [Thermoplasmata archaeon]|jgi:large subunit ribosomal protein L39e|nr:50S ribosomal protein L39e [Thermoplasmata archaeon]
MANRRKSSARKTRLNRAVKQNRRVPAWVMQRTSRRVVRHPKRRTWKRGHLHK